MAETANRSALQFLLVPDASAARRLRRELATARARSGVAVGTWHDLLRQARDAYFIAVPAEGEGDFEQALRSIEGAFWIESLEADPDETANALRREFVDLVSASDPDKALADLDVSGLAERPRRRLGDLLQLSRRLDGRLPGELETMRRLLRADAAEGLQPICVHHVSEQPHTTRWQAAVIEKLNGDSGAAGLAPDTELGEALEKCLQERPRAAEGSALGILQRHLFGTEQEVGNVDESAQWVSVRDFLQEAETAAGMAQQLLAADPDLKPSSIGLLVPDSFEYSVALEDAFGLGGLALSGLPGERWQRDLGHEAVFHFLFCREPPAPAMALAVCFSSRLMPWPTEVGARMAQAIMDGDYSPELPPDSGGKAKKMRQLLLARDGELSTLPQALEEFAALLTGGERFEAHAARARVAVERVRSQLAAAAKPDWPELRRSVQPQMISSGNGQSHNLDGITVWHEGEEPWRHVQHLFVLGFSRGRYPSEPANSSVLSEEEREQIRDTLGLHIALKQERQLRQRRLFRRQLESVSGSVTFLVPHRDPAGKLVAASATMPFIGQLLGAPKAASSLIATLDLAQDRERIRHLAAEREIAACPPRSYGCEAVRLDRDLLALRVDGDGKPRPESPSGLETLLISPLAWLLRCVKAEPLQWAPETPDLRILGNLAHGVLEQIFTPGGDLPKEDEIRGCAEQALGGLIQQQAPFLDHLKWRVDRRELEAVVARAAGTWHRMLSELEATVVGAEQWLAGDALDVKVHGKTDLILATPDGSLLVVDYKLSKAGGRRKRMEKGYEIQASLYRTLARAQTAVSDKDAQAGLAAQLTSASDVGIAYFTMRDGTCLSDAPPPGGRKVTGWQTVGGNVAGKAIELVQQRIEQVRAGEVQMNSAGDRLTMKNDWGVTPYALDRSPLIDLFAKDGGRRES